MEIIQKNKKMIAVIRQAETPIADGSALLDLIMSARYAANCDHIVLAKEILCEEFFILSTGIAGELLQKLVNYHVKAAIYGDFSRYTSKPLRDFIYESNHGKHIFFVPTESEAIEKLSEIS